MMIETKQRQQRVVLSEPVELDLGAAGGRVPATALNLSAGGVFVSGCPITSVGQRLACKLLFTPREPLIFRCRVVWTQPEVAAGKPPGMGLQFEDLSEQRAGDLSTLIQRLSSRTEVTPGNGITIDPFCESGTWARTANLTANAVTVEPSPSARRSLSHQPRAWPPWLFHLAIGLALLAGFGMAFLLR